GERNVELMRGRGFPQDKVLAAGVVDGRNIWISDMAAILSSLDDLSSIVPFDHLFLNPSSSLQHVPVDVRLEQGLDPRLIEWLAFAEQKLAEVVTLTAAFNDGRQSVDTALRANAEVLDH